MNYTWTCQYCICDLQDFVSEVEEQTFIFARREDMVFAPPLFGVDMVPELDLVVGVANELADERIELFVIAECFRVYFLRN